MSRSFNDTSKSKEYTAPSRMITINNQNAITEEERDINPRNREDSNIDVQKLNKSASFIDPKGASIKPSEFERPAQQNNEGKEPSVPQCGYKVYKPLRNPYNASIPAGDTRYDSMASSHPQNPDAIKPYKR
jgi:hypothetical protein